MGEWDETVDGGEAEERRQLLPRENPRYRKRILLIRLMMWSWLFSAELDAIQAPSLVAIGRYGDYERSEGTKCGK